MNYKEADSYVDIFCIDISNMYRDQIRVTERESERVSEREREREKERKRERERE